MIPLSDPFDAAYFHQEIAAFYTLMGSKSAWAEGKVEAAHKAINHLYLTLLPETVARACRVEFEAVNREYTRRSVFMAAL